MATDANRIRTEPPPAVAMRRHLVDTRLGQMHVRTAGEGGVPLLLVHSQIVSGKWYDWAIPLLAADRMVIVPDRIGFGDSDPQERQLSMADYAEATVDALDALGVEQVDAVGIHTGAKEVVDLCVAHAARVRRAVLITISVYTDEELRQKVRAQYAQAPPGPTADGSHLDFYWGWWASFVPEQLGLELASEYFVDHMKAGPNYWWTFLASTEDPTEKKLPRIEQPLLVMVPHDDSYQGASDALALLPPQAEVVDLPDITHVVNVFTTHVDEIVERIRRFLA